MNARKTTEQLSWSELTKNFPVGSYKINGKVVKINALADAINDGTLTKMIQEAADELHNGNVHAVYCQLSKNLSNWLCLHKDADYWPTKKVDMERYDLLRDFVDAGMQKCKVDAGVNTKSYWQWSVAEIEAITDYRTAKSVYDNIASYKQKKLDKALDKALWDEADMRQKIARSMMKATKPVDNAVTDTILAKLQNGDALTQDEAAELLKALSK